MYIIIMDKVNKYAGIWKNANINDDRKHKYKKCSLF